MTNTSTPEDAELLKKVEAFVNDAYALGRGQTDRLVSDYSTPDRSIANQIFSEAQSWRDRTRPVASDTVRTWWITDDNSSYNLAYYV